MLIYELNKLNIIHTGPCAVNARYNVNVYISGKQIYNKHQPYFMKHFYFFFVCVYIFCSFWVSSSRSQHKLIVMVF